MKSDVGAAAYVPLWILLHNDLQAGAKVLWALLQGAWTDRDGVGEPSRAQLAAELNVSVGSVDRYLKKLLSVNALKVEAREGDTNTYRVILARVITTDQGGVIIHDHPQQDKSLAVSELEDQEQTQLVKREKKERSKVIVLNRFHQFWAKYPRKVRKVTAQRQWIKLKVETNTNLWVDIMSGLYRTIEMWESEGREQRYIPHAVRFLKEEMWTDECEVQKKKPTLSRQSKGLLEASNRFLERHGTDND
jgi:hypothetical protein